MKMVVLIILVCKVVSGFLVQNGSSGILNTQITDDKTLQNVLNLIVNEQNARLMLQSLVTTLSDRVHQLENEVVQIQKNADSNINRTEQEMTSKLNAMNNRLVQMEHFNANVSKQLQKEKNNREHLEQLYTAIEKKLNNSTFTQINVTDLAERLENVSNENSALKSDIANLTLQTNLLSNVTDEVLKTTTRKHGPLGFAVYEVDKTSATSSSEKLKFLKVVYNSGDGYNMSSGIFTCVYPGLYFFTATMFRKPGFQSQCYFHVNNRQLYAVNSGTDNTGGYMSGSQSTVVKLNTGEQVYLATCVGVDLMHEFSSFSGFLIST